MNRENNVLVYLEDEEFYFEFNSNNIFEDIYIIAELLWVGKYHNLGTYYYYGEITDDFDRFYSINSYDRKRMIEYMDISMLLATNSDFISHKIEQIKSLNIWAFGDELINQMKAVEEEEFQLIINDDRTYMTDDKLSIFKNMNVYKFKAGFGE